MIGMNGTGPAGPSRRRFYTTILPGAAASLLAPPGALPAPTRTALQERRAVREAILRATATGMLPGVVALVQDDGTRPRINVAGWRDMHRRERMHPDNLFDVRSITKVVTALASLLLVANGKLSLDDPIDGYLGEKRGTARNHSDDQAGMLPQPITVRQLLTHTSGLSPSRPASLAELTESRNVPLADVASRILAEPRSAAPGTQWMYSSPGYAVLGRLLEVASGTPFDAFVTRRILVPLGMRSTTFHPTGKVRRRMASLYHWQGGRIREWPRMMPPVRWRYTAPDFGLYSTAADVASLFGSMLPGARGLLPESLRALMLTGHVATDVPKLKQGLGWMVSEGDELCDAMGLSSGCFGHNGAFGSMAWASLPQRRIVVFLTQCLHNESQAGVDVVRMSLCRTLAVQPG